MSTHRRRSAAGLLLLAGLLLTTGCGGLDERRSAASDTALEFEQSLRSGNGAAACALLAPGTRDELEQSAGARCRRAVLAEEMPPAHQVRRVDVHGRQARVTLTADTLFLALFSTGWKVTAAGCTSRPDQPYDCTVEGG